MASCEFSKGEDIQSSAFDRKEHDNFLGLGTTSAYGHHEKRSHH
jgi:hypothetical protein